MKASYQNILNRIPLENQAEYTDWLEPSEKSWENIKKKTPIGKRNRNNIIVPIAFGIVLISFLFYFSSVHKYNSSPSEIETMANLEKVNIESTDNAELNKITNTSSINTPTTNPSFKSDFATTSIDKTNAFSKVRDSNISQISNVISGINLSGILTDKNIAASDVAYNIIDVEGTPESNQQYKTTSLFIYNSSNIVENIPSINNFLSIENYPFDLTPTVKVSELNKNKWSLGVLMAYSPLSNVVDSYSDAKPLEETVTDERYKNQKSLGIEISRKISPKWSLSFQPNVILDKLTTTYSLDIPYDFNSEVINENLNVNKFSHSLPNDLGSTATDLVVTRKSNSSILHNENVNYTLKTKHNLATLSLPILAKYNILKYKNSSINVLAGTTFEYQLSSIVKSEILQSHHSDIDTHSISLNDEKTSRNIGFGFNLGSEYNYKISANTEIGLSINYTQLLIESNRQNRNNLQLVVRKNL